MPAPAGIRSWRALAGTLAQGLSAKWYAGLPSGANSFVFPLFLNAGVPLPITDDFARRSGFGPIANFCGAYIENAFSEPQETWIELECNAAPAHSSAELVSRDESPAVEPMLDIAYDDSPAWWFE